MTNLADFRTYAQANMMELEAILSEVYAEAVRGQSGFALFDGGAHRGFHTTRMLDLAGCEKVYAVEADPFMGETLETAMKAYAQKVGEAETAHRLVIVHKALQADPAVITIPWKSSHSHVGRSSIVSDNTERNTIWGENPDMQYRDQMEVEATTIDLILANEARPLPFLKLDLEGADLLSLKGAATTLADKRPIVAFENSIHAPKVHGFTLDEMAAYFAGLDYVPMNFVGEPIGPDNWFGFFEAWAAPREQAEWLSQTVGQSIAKRPV